ncbi:MAG: RsiV family protein, partial [Anaerolineaceae bacterium]|nr:RsiV family protein [Anaerolineaceae bacterium]
ENLEYQASLSKTFGYNSLHLEYTPTNTEHGIVSIHFTVSTYAMGAAHPFSYSRTLNYDLAKEKTLQLDELFLPGSDYLGVLSTQSIQIISENGYMDWPEGAAPEPENFRNWNITPDGILITFDPYEIAPYAVGPQQALVPYTALENMIDPDGPLGIFLS